MNMLFIKNFFVGFMVSEITRVSDGHCPYSGTVRIRLLSPIYIYIYIYICMYTGPLTLDYIIEHITRITMYL